MRRWTVADPCKWDFHLEQFKQDSRLQETATIHQDEK